jgi:hypothetical protein
MQVFESSDRIGALGEHIHSSLIFAWVRVGVLVEQSPIQAELYLKLFPEAPSQLLMQVIPSFDNISPSATN